MAEIPDVVALPLPLAKERLSISDIELEIEKIYPTKPAKGNGIWRVVRQNVRDGKLHIVIAEEIEGITP